MASLPLLTVILLQLVALVVQQVAHHKETTRWMRMLSSKEHIPLLAMEGAEPPAEAPSQPRAKPRISFPIPGAALFRPAAKEPNGHGKR